MSNQSPTRLRLDNSGVFASETLHWDILARTPWRCVDLRDKLFGPIRVHSLNGFHIDLCWNQSASYSIKPVSIFFIFSLYILSSQSLYFNTPTRSNRQVNNRILKICAITPRSSSDVGTVDIQLGPGVLFMRRLIFDAAQMSWL